MSKKHKQHQQIVPGNALAINVVGTEMSDLSFAIKAWKRKVKNSNILNIVKDKKEFIKPSVTKRKEQSRASYIQQIKSANV